jgi:hypothetical protein
MFRLIKFLFWCAAVAALIYVAVTVPLGKRTFWGHLKQIWHSDATQDLVNGTKDAAKNAYDKAKEPASK